MERGRLLYQMPINIYEKNRKSELIRVYFLLFILFVLGTFMIFSFLRDVGVGFFFLILVLFVVFIILDILSSAKISRFEIYTNGFVPATKPLRFTLKRKQYFIMFNDVINVEYRCWGEVCALILPNGKEVLVTVDWKDINGYIKFSEIIKQHFPNIKTPNFSIVKERFNAWQNKLDGKITKEEHDRIFNKMVEINKDFV